jgi:predicted nucleotidyltransferase
MTLETTLQDDLDTVRCILLRHFRDYKVKIFLFGSHARGTPVRTSDIDVAILPEQFLPIGLLSEARHILEESNILASVDLLDLSTTSQELFNRILKEGVVWKG